MAAGVNIRAHSARASSLVLSAGDVQAAYGSGFRAAFSEVLTNAMARSAYSHSAPGLAPLLAGRETGYIDEFARNTTQFKGGKVTVKPGVSAVISGINVYKSAAYAQSSVKAGLKSRPKSVKGVTYTFSRLSGVGENGILVVSKATLPGLPTSYGVIIGFERGRYTATVAVSAYGTSPAQSSVVGLAKIIDARIQSHG
jgi:hypothetical protein